MSYVVHTFQLNWVMRGSIFLLLPYILKASSLRTASECYRSSSVLLFPTPSQPLLWPPNVKAGPTSRCALTQTFPASRFWAIYSPCTRSLVHTDAPWPICVLLAPSMTSSSVDHGMSGTIGPGYLLIMNMEGFMGQGKLSDSM